MTTVSRQTSRGPHGRIWPSLCLLVLLTVVAVLVHGYHAGVEDQEVYLSAIKKDLNPSLYPYNSALFMTQMRGAVFCRLLASCTRISRLPVETVAFAVHLLTIFLVLLGCWMIGRRCFRTQTAVWSGLLLVTGFLTIPIAGTALYVVDQYLHPRAMATAAILYALTALLDGRRVRGAAWLLAAALLHPLMAAFGVSYALFLLWRRPPGGAAEDAALIPLGISAAWKRAAQPRSYYFVTRWAWYEWLGVALPLVIAWWCARFAKWRGLFTAALMYRRLVSFGLFQLAVALILAAPPLARLSAFQPMRWMHLFYTLFFLLTGGLIGDFILGRHVWRWLALFVPLFAAMLCVQRQLFPGSAHVELGCGQNDWCQAFAWVRQNTPPDAYFALNPRYANLAGEDHHGFRAFAERSMLEEESEDAGAATVFPGLLDSWYEQSQALEGWERFEAADFKRLHDRLGVGWALLEREVPGLSCPYRNRSVRVCRLS
jgi:hypothetical protein